MDNHTYQCMIKDIWEGSSMDVFMIFATMIFLAWMGLGIYITVLQELHKKSKGIAIGERSIQDVEKILKERLIFSYVEEIRINSKGDIEFGCKYGLHIGKINDGIFHVDKTSRKFSGFRDVEEAWYLQKCIEKIFNIEKEKEVDDLETKFAKYIKIFNIARAVKYIFYICIIIIAFRQIGGMDSIKSRGVSQMYFTDYSEDKSIGEILKNTCKDISWSNSKVGDNIYVFFSGKCPNGSILNIVFKRRGEECEVESIEIDGEDYTLFQRLVFEALYSNSFDGINSDDDLGIDQLEQVEEVPVNEYPVEASEADDTEKQNNEQDEDIDQDEYPKHEYTDSLIGEYWCYMGEDCGANISIFYDDYYNLYISGGSYWGEHVGQVDGQITEIYDNGVLVYEDDGGNRLTIYPKETGGVYIEEEGAFGGEGTTFSGDYDRVN